MIAYRKDEIILASDITRGFSGVLNLFSSLRKSSKVIPLEDVMEVYRKASNRM